MTRKQAILQAAARLFARQGFRHTSVADISKLTGVAQGTIFYHFSSKEGLFIAALEQVRRTIVAQVQDHLASRSFSSGLEMVEGIVAFYLRLAGHIGEPFMLLHRYDAYEFATQNPACRAQLEAIYDCILDIFEQAIRLGQQDGSIRGLPARKTALLLFAMTDGLVRLETYHLYDAAALAGELGPACRRILENYA